MQSYASNRRAQNYGNYTSNGCGCDPCHKPKPGVCNDCDKIININGNNIINTSYEIINSGVYHLCGDINWNGGDNTIAIVINADNVVLNLNEFHIIDNGATKNPPTKNTAAILVKSGVSNYVITNGSITGFGSNGIYIETKTVNGDINNLNISSIGGGNKDGNYIRGVGETRPVYYGGAGPGGAVVAGIVIAGQNANNYWSDTGIEFETKCVSVNNVKVCDVVNYGLNTISVGIYLTGISDITVDNCIVSNVKGGNTAVGIGGASVRGFKYLNNNISDISSADGVGPLNVSFSAFGAVENNTVNDCYNIYGVKGFDLPNPNRYVNGIAGNYCNTVNFRNNSTSNIRVIYDKNYDAFKTKYANGISLRGSVNTTIVGHMDTNCRNEFYRNGVSGAFTGNSYMIRSTADLKYPNSVSGPETIQNNPYTTVIKNFVSNKSDVGLYFDGVDGPYGLSEIAVSDTQIYWSKKADVLRKGKVSEPIMNNTGFRTMLIE